MAGRHVKPALLVMLCLWWLPPDADASHCAAYRNVNLNLLIDYSRSMEGAKHETARTFGLRVIDELVRVERLRRAGGNGFPARRGSRPNGFVLPVTDNVAVLRDSILFAPGPNGRDTPLYAVLEDGARHLDELDAPGLDILVAVTDGRDSYRSTIARNRAISELSSLSAWKYLVFFGDDPVASSLCSDQIDEGAIDLCDIALATGSEFRSAGAGTETELANRVLDQACSNYAPTVSLTGPSELRLGASGFSARFDAGASRDRAGETRFEDLDFAWTLTPLTGGGSPRTGGGRGSAGAFFEPTFTDEDIGSWGVEVEVADGSGGRHLSTRTLEVLGSRPRLDLQGGGVINALEPIEVYTGITEDVDGGPALTFEWVLNSAPDGGRHPEDTRWTDAAVPPWVTDENDITVLSDGTTRFDDAWVFLVTAQDNEMETETGSVTVEVANLVPAPRIEGPESIRTGETISLAGMDMDDPDGGGNSITWDVLQAPDSDPEGGARPDAWTSSARDIPTDDRHAGSWIFRLEVTDSEGEPKETEQAVLVDADPEVVFDADEIRIGSLTGRLELDGSASFDPDTDNPHTHLERAESENLSPGIVRWTWSLVDVPIEQWVEFPTGEVADVLGVPGRSATLNLDPGTLAPGEWTFQLEVEDGEDNVASDQVRVTVVDEETRPVAIASAPRRYALDALNQPSGPVTVSGIESYDPDGILTGVPGIDEYRWEIVGEPLCTDFMPPSGAAVWELFPASSPIPASCHGVWHLRLTVVDDDVPTPREDSTATQIILSGDCSGVCLLWPTLESPAMVGQSERIDIPIYYHLGARALAHPAFGSGMIARLRIFDSNDESTPVHTSFDTNPAAMASASSLMFRWNGNRGDSPPRWGAYDVEVSLLDASMTTVFSIRYDRAIAIGGPRRVFDCGDLWARGFPDGRDGGAFPCVKYEEPFSMPPGVPVRVFHSPAGTSSIR